jgi:hypothetical protein
LGSVGLAAIGIAVAIFLRRRPVGFVLALGFLALTAGFAVATFKTALIAHPVLRYPGIMAQTPEARVLDGTVAPT